MTTKTDAKKTFFVKARQLDADGNPTDRWNEVGVVFLHGNEKDTGALLLNHLPGIRFALFAKDEAKSEPEAAPKKK